MGEGDRKAATRHASHAALICLDIVRKGVSFSERLSIDTKMNENKHEFPRNHEPSTPKGERHKIVIL